MTALTTGAKNVPLTIETSTISGAGYAWESKAPAYVPTAKMTALTTGAKNVPLTIETSTISGAGYAWESKASARRYSRYTKYCYRKGRSTGSRGQGPGGPTP